MFPWTNVLVLPVDNALWFVGLIMATGRVHAFLLVTIKTMGMIVGKQRRRAWLCRWRGLARV